MKKIYTLLCFSLLAGSFRAQQDPQYSLYQFNMLIINPAYAGGRDGLSAVASNRQQWMGMNGSPKTTALSLHGPILKKNLGLGLTITNDMMGPRNVTSIYGNVAYLLKISSDMRLSFGLNAGYNRYQFNFDKITWKAEEAPSQLFQNQTTNTLDINGGLYLKTSKAFVSVSASHLNQPTAYSYDAGKISYKLATHMFVGAGYSFDLKDNILFSPTILVKMVSGNLSMDINANFLINRIIWVGAFYRTGYGPGLLMQWYITNKFRAGISYDTGLQAQRRLGPSFEAMIGFDFGGNRAKMTNPRFL